IFFLPFFGRVNAQAAKDYFDAGTDLSQKGQFDQAIDNFGKAIKLATNPQLTYNAYCARGYAYQSKRLFDLSIQDYTRAINLRPNDLFAYGGRGNSYYGKGMNDSAFSDYNRYVIGQPNNGFGYYSRGNIYLVKRMYDSAIQDYTKVISINPKPRDAYTARANCFASEKKLDLAIQDLNAAINIDSTFINPYNARGLVYMSMGEYELAVNDYKKAISLDVKKDKPYAIINIIGPLSRLHRFSEAAGFYNDYKSKYSGGYIEDPSWAFFKKFVQAVTKDLSANDYTTALMDLNEAERLYSSKNKGGADNDDGQKRGYSSILALKGYVFEKLNNNDGAKQAYEQALIINNLEPDVTAALQKLTQQKQVLVKNDNTPPVINILEPLANSRSISVDDDKVAGTKQHIRGQAIDESGIKSVMLNNKFLKVEDNGYFDTVVDVAAGINIFTIVATDKNANSVSQNLQIVTGKDKTNSAPANQNNNIVLSSNPVYHAIMIAECDYADKNIPSLQGPSSDMTKIYNLLVNNYAFPPANTDTLINASRTSILEAIIKKANAMSENDNLFIFYAGHGQMITQPDNSEEGFLVPQDAIKDILSTYISSDDLLRTIKYSKAKHILFVADACFAGSLFRDIPSNAPVPVAEAYKDKSRRLLASGNRTAVPDRSEFIEFLRLALQENHAPYITAEQLINSFRDQYTTSTHLTLQYYPIKDVDDLGGQFVFIRK
ncbi:MAG TPA: tetratricopeptide repeat protein, partial [Puia sp.]|nr:tetratricopeptide repeat protein [Puia sp.]